MKKVLRFFMVFLSVGLLLAVAAFIALAMYYRNNFPVNTWINGVYCTGKTVCQVNEELVEGQEASMITIVDADGIYWEMDMQTAGVRPDYTEQLDAYLHEHATFDWLRNLKNTVVEEFLPGKYIVAEEQLRAAYGKLAFVAAEEERGRGVSVVYTKDGYILKDENARHLDLEKSFSWLKACLDKGQTTIFLEQEICYQDIPDNEADAEQRRIWEQVCEYTDRCSSIIYDMGTEKIVLTPDISGSFLKREESGGNLLLDEEGNIMVDEASVRKWVGELKDAYDTWGTERDFQTTKGTVVRVAYDTYGTELDGEAEAEYLFQALQSEYEGSQVHIPAYTREGFSRGLDDIGNTYIEIDMSDQKMYYYLEGELVLETEVVTGDTSKGRGTPSGINYVYNMQRNRTLRGSGYASFVKYWMPIKGGVGIHDADWRRDFGGEIYKTNGSHGCINTPVGVMGELYDMAETGTPVITFY